MAKDLLEAMTNVVKSVGNDVENAIQNLNDEAQANKYIKRLNNTNLTDKAASILLPRMSQFYEVANLSEDTKKELFQSISDKANHLQQRGLLTDELRDKVYGLMNKTVEKPTKPIELTISPPPQTAKDLGIPSSARSSSNASSTSDGSSESGESYVSSQGSRKSTANVLNQLGKTPKEIVDGPPNSPPKALGLEEDIKGPTKSPPSCMAGIKKALSSCCSYLSNGLRSVCDSFTNKNMQKYANLGNEDLPRDPKATPKRERTGNNANRTNAGGSDQKNGSFFSSLRTIMSRSNSQTTSPIGGLASQRTSIHFTTFKQNHNGRWVSQEAGSIPVPTATDIRNAVYSGASRGTRSFVKGVTSVVRTTSGVAEFMATPGERSSMTWVERFEDVSNSTRGMSSNNEYGVRAAARDAVGFACEALEETPKALIPGERAAKIAGDVAGSIARRGARILSSSNARFTIPTSWTR
jgi:hypothetical protein